MNFATMFAAMPCLRRVPDSVEVLALLKPALVAPLVALAKVLPRREALEVFDRVVSSVSVDVVNVKAFWDRASMMLPNVSMKVRDATIALRPMPVKPVGSVAALWVAPVLPAVPFHPLDHGESSVRSSSP